MPESLDHVNTARQGPLNAAVCYIDWYHLDQQKVHTTSHELCIMFSLCWDCLLFFLLLNAVHIRQDYVIDIGVDIRMPCTSDMHHVTPLWAGKVPATKQSTTKPCAYLTHWGRAKMAAVSQTTLSNALSWMKMLEFRLKFHWSLFLRVQLTTIQHWFR